MGEMADMLIEQMWDVNEEDWPEEGPFPPRTFACRCCGRGGLVWGQRNGKWRLHDERGMHLCPVNPLKEPLGRERKTEVDAPAGEWLPLPAGYKMSEYRRRGA